MSAPGTADDSRRRPTGARTPVGTAALAVASGTVVASALHLVPSVVSLGQWSALRVLPGRWCRWRGPARSRVALTFDDGPDPHWTPRVLDRLDELGLAATFFCLGERVRAHPGVVGEIRRRGHAVGVHGDRHLHHFAHSPGWVRRDVERACAALEAEGVPPRWLRPPYGQVTAGTMWAARRLGLELVLWSAWGREWASTDSQRVAGRVIDGLDEGAIVLLHDSDTCSPPGTVDRVLDALAPIAAEMRARGLAAVTLDDLVGQP